MKSQVLFAAVCSLAIIIGCSSQNREKGYIYYRLNSNPTTLDPALIVDVTGGSISAKLFNGLVKIGEDLKIHPDIAKNWVISKDGLTYIFRLKRGVLFSNNREVKSNDIKYSFNRLLNPKNKSPNTWVLEKILGANEFMEGKADNVKGIKTIDDYTIKIRLKKPFSPFINLLAMPAAYIVPIEEVERWGPDFSTHPVGTGPFILEEWLPNREIRLLKNYHYFDIHAKIKGIIYRIIPEDLTAVTEFDVGNIDVITIPASEYSRYKNDLQKKNLISSIEGLNTYYLGLNCSRLPFSNRALRKAITYAIDREKILNTIYEKRGRLALGPVPDIIRNWDMPDINEYNPNKSIELIKKEGLEGIEINFYITADQEAIDIAEVIQSYINAIGININIKQLEWSAYKDSLNNGEPDMFYISWWADYPDPENFLFPLFHSSNFGSAGNRTRYSNTTVDYLIEKGQYTMDAKKRSLFYKQAERIIVSDSPWVFLWHRTDFIIKQPTVRNFKNYLIYSIDKGTEISL